MSHFLAEKKADTNLPTYIMFLGMQRTVSKYVTAVRELEDNLLFESKFEGKKHQLDIAEGDIFKDIQEVSVEAIST